MTELKRCPFCGEEIYYYFPFLGADFDGHCRNKNCFMYGIEITFGDVAKYNTRPIEDELQAEIKQLRESLRIAGTKYALALKEMGWQLEEADKRESNQPKAECA